MTDHTDGPWEISHLGKDGAWEIRVEGFVICSRNRIDDLSLQSIANAKLIAAAPDMLAALKLAFKIPRPWILGGRTVTEEEWGAAVDAVSAAIAKATE
jgi:hypothetical protein